jgi:hypothetical protein
MRRNAEGMMPVKQARGGRQVGDVGNKAGEELSTGEDNLGWELSPDAANATSFVS